MTVTSKPSECTHLLAVGVVRTEKFLTAVANGAHILKKEWATESAKAGKILREHLGFYYTTADRSNATTCVAESKYLLKDPGNKHGVDLQQSLERARQTKLFAGKTFYVSGKSVASTVPLLKTVVAAGGGQVRFSLPCLTSRH